MQTYKVPENSCQKMCVKKFLKICIAEAKNVREQESDKVDGVVCVL